MKTRVIFIVFTVSLLFSACKKINIDSIGGTQSPIGMAGATVSSPNGSVTGVSSLYGSVTVMYNGVSTLNWSAYVTNTVIKNILAGYSGTTFVRNRVSVTNVKIRLTSEGIESFGPLEPGIIARYDAKAGDTYPCSSGKRIVTSVSKTADFSWNNLLIKVIKVEENPNNADVMKIVYYANEKWGLVEVDFTFKDNSVARFPLIASTSN